MHRSCLSSIMIDCRTDDAAGAANFWGAALGGALRPEHDPTCVGIVVADSQPRVTVQAVSHESRVHLDIETDDVEAEVRRLEGLGAVRFKRQPTYWVMQAPTGQRFCVVTPKRPDFEAIATVWLP